jgi:pimeloyl-ACP methyl ester carboxylesterase
VSTIETYQKALPTGIESHFIDNINGLRMHYLEAGRTDKNRPTLLLLHGFPELAFSWRKIMLPLAQAGFHVIAPEQRGYGLTTGGEPQHGDVLANFRMFNLALDALAFLQALGHKQVDAVLGHDFGSPVAAYCALMRPDVFTRLVMMSAPSSGAPPLPFDTLNRAGKQSPDKSFHQWLDAELAALDPPRKHYQWYYSGAEANADMMGAPEGMHDFLRAYYHSKSADLRAKPPHPLEAATALELARMPDYYAMNRAEGMAATIARYMPSADQIAACTWMREAELNVYVTVYQQTGFQGALNWYRCVTNPEYVSDLRLFSRKTIDVPACFIGGTSDWGVYQTPHGLERMEKTLCTRYQGTHLIEGAGHWVQQEQAQQVCERVLQFLDCSG